MESNVPAETEEKITSENDTKNDKEIDTTTENTATEASIEDISKEKESNVPENTEEVITSDKDTKKDKETDITTLNEESIVDNSKEKECNEEPLVISGIKNEENASQLMEDLNKIVIEDERTQPSHKNSLSENDFKLEAMEVLGFLFIFIIFITKTILIVLLNSYFLSKSMYIS